MSSDLPEYYFQRCARMARLCFRWTPEKKRQRRIADGPDRRAEYPQRRRSTTGDRVAIGW